MKLSNVLFLIFTALVFLFAISCAKQGTPTGGPRDTIPPAVINSIPENQSLNFKGNELFFLFDERINADKLKQQLIISPNTDLEYSYVVKKDRLIIKLDNALEDSITYTFNFLDGVTDITDKTPAVNLKLAFSTGPYIDSIFVKGQVNDLLNNEASAKYTVGLYDVDDTVTIFNGKPKYFTTVDESGSYNIENIKIGQYRIYTWNDVNRNLLLETEKEAYAFLRDTLDLSVSKDSVDLKTVKINTEEPEVLSARAAGRYFDVRYNKQLLNYTATPATEDKPLANQLKNPDKLIRFYNTIDIKETDSITYYIQVTDSLSQSSTDTVQVKFRETKKKPDELKIDKKEFENLVNKNIGFTINFSKPIAQVSYDSIRIGLDTIAFISLQDLLIISTPRPIINDSVTTDSLGVPDIKDNFTWNTTRTQLSFDMPFNWKYVNDSIAKVNERFTYLDSISTDTTRAKFQPISQNNVKVILDKGALISVESDTLSRNVFDYKYEDVQDLGMFIVTLNTSYNNYWLEVLEKDKKTTVRSVKITDQNNVTISRLKPGNYAFIIKLDDNNDGIWSYGNILNNEEPETIIFTGVESALRANFEVNIKLDF
ncbi:MAG: Ig-like domain-containing domain [Bacteroidota bacterium]